jgi:hypothetical protein
LTSEFARLDKYSQKGDLAPAERVLEYMKRRDARAADYYE